jgi:hypothetical protein
MNTNEKKEFISNLVAAVRDDLLNKVDAMPDEWNGIELRQLIADKFKEQTRADLMKGKRGRDFRNEVIVKNI